MLTSLPFSTQTTRFTEDLILPYGAYNNLLELLTEDNLLVLTSLGTVCDQLEEVASILLNIFESQGSAVRYLSQLIAHEVKSCKDPNTIFRGNTLTSKSLDTYMKVVGHDYLTSVLKETLDEIFSDKKICELDPTRSELVMNLNVNLSQLFLRTYSSSPFLNCTDNV